MSKPWAGPVVAGLIVVGVAAILVANLQTGRESLARDKPSSTIAPPADQSSVASPPGGSLREYPIGEPVEKNHVQVAAVWLKGVAMDGMPAMPDVIHLEADIRATEGNPNGFAKDEFVPYLKVSYTLMDASGTKLEEGAMPPMVASDGMHYGASVAMPKPGKYSLTYQIDPPSAGGLGRHVGLGGVAPWWAPFNATFEWIVDTVGKSSGAN